jgi:hypothetical protein
MQPPRTSVSHHSRKKPKGKGAPYLLLVRVWATAQYEKCNRVVIMKRESACGRVPYALYPAVVAGRGGKGISKM